MTERRWLAHYPRDVDWHAPLTPAPLWRLLDDAVEKFPDRPAMDFLGKVTTYRQLGEQVARAAAGFKAIGVKQGVQVGLFLPNCPQFVISFFAILKAGGTVVHFSPLYSEKELLHQVEDSETDMMVTLNLEALYPKMNRVMEQSRLQ